MELYPNHFTRNHCKSRHLRISLKKGRLPYTLHWNEQSLANLLLQAGTMGPYKWAQLMCILQYIYEELTKYIEICTACVEILLSVNCRVVASVYIRYSVHDTINIYFWNSGLHSCFRSIFLIDSYTKCTNKEKSENFMTRKTIKKLEHFEIWWIFWCVLKLKSLSNF